METPAWRRNLDIFQGLLQMWGIITNMGTVIALFKHGSGFAPKVLVEPVPRSFIGTQDEAGGVQFYCVPCTAFSNGIEEFLIQITKKKRLRRLPGFFPLLQFQSIVTTWKDCADCDFVQFLAKFDNMQA